MPGADEGEFALRLAFSFEDEDSPEDERAGVVEWGALRFLMPPARRTRAPRG